MGYRMMLGLSGSAVDTMLNALASFAQTLFCLSSAMLFAAGGVIYMLARLIV